MREHLGKSCLKIKEELGIVILVLGSNKERVCSVGATRLLAELTLKRTVFVVS